MKRLLFLLTALGAGANTCYVGVAEAQSPPVVTSVAAKQLTEGWANRTATHEFACVSATRGTDGVVVIDSVGPTIAASADACKGQSGIVHYVDEAVKIDKEFAVLAAVLRAHPGWTIAGDVWHGMAFMVTRRIQSPFATT